MHGVSWELTSFLAAHKRDRPRRVEFPILGANRARSGLRLLIRPLQATLTDTDEPARVWIMNWPGAGRTLATPAQSAPRQAPD